MVDPKYLALACPPTWARRILEVWALQEVLDDPESWRPIAREALPLIWFRDEVGFGVRRAAEIADWDFLATGHYIHAAVGNTFLWEQFVELFCGGYSVGLEIPPELLKLLAGDDTRAEQRFALKHHLITPLMLDRESRGEPWTSSPPTSGTPAK